MVNELYKVLAIPSESIARAIAYAIEQPADVDVNEIVIPADGAGFLSHPSSFAGAPSRMLPRPRFARSGGYREESAGGGG